MNIRNVPACFLIGAASGLAGCKAVETPRSAAYEVLPGTWEWRHDKRLSCEENPHTIHFSEDRKEMILTYAKPKPSVVGETATVRYRVLSDAPDLRVVIVGEKRRTPSGGLAIWDVILKSPDRYCWHRTDWKPGACTGTNDRCRDEQEAAAGSTAATTPR